MFVCMNRVLSLQSISIEETILSEDKKVVYVFLKPGSNLDESFIMVQHNRNEELEICLYMAKCISYQMREDVGESR